MDAIDYLLSLPAESAALCCTDPPYASLEKHRAVGTTTRLDKWFEVVPNSYFPAFFAEVYRVLKRDSHLYLFCDQETMFAIKPMGEAAGFKFWKPLIFDKVSIGMGYHYRCRYEMILFFEKGKRRLADLGIADVLPFKRVTNGVWPTQKPAGLIDVLIEQSSSVGEVVLDPFCGSGVVPAEAVRLGRQALWNDLSPEAEKLTWERVKQHTPGDEVRAEPKSKIDPQFTLTSPGAKQ
jgi:site-specific DNA-methyltransferase (adenine-specific)